MEGVRSCWRCLNALVSYSRFEPFPCWTWLYIISNSYWKSTQNVYMVTHLRHHLCETSERQLHCVWFIIPTTVLDWAVFTDTSMCCDKGVFYWNSVAGSVLHVLCVCSQVAVGCVCLWASERAVETDKVRVGLSRGVCGGRHMEAVERLLWNLI